MIPQAGAQAAGTSSAATAQQHDSPHLSVLLQQLTSHPTITQILQETPAPGEQTEGNNQNLLDLLYRFTSNSRVGPAMMVATPVKEEQKNKGATQRSNAIARKINDCNKKRRKREKTTELLQQLNSVLPPLRKRGMSRSIHDILADATTSIRTKTEKMATQAEKNANVSLRLGNAASSQSFCQFFSIPSSRMMEMESMRHAVLSCQHTAILVVNSDLDILDLNALASAILAGRELAYPAPPIFSEHFVSTFSKINLAEFISASDVDHIKTACVHCNTAILDIDNSRRFVVGAHFRGQRGALPRHMPVEVVPCSGNLFGRMFTLYVHPVDESATPKQICGVLKSCAPCLNPSGFFSGMDVCEERDEEGRHKFTEIHKQLDPMLALLRMLRLVQLSGNAQQLHDMIRNIFPHRPDLWAPFEEFLQLREVAGWKPAQMSETDYTDNMIGLLGPNTQLKLEEEGDSVLLKLYMHGVAVWTAWMEIDEKSGELALKTCSVLNPGSKADIGIRCHLLKNGDLWICNKAPQSVPLVAPGQSSFDPSKMTSVSMYINGFWTVVDGISLTTKKYMVCQDRCAQTKTYTQTKTFCQAQVPQKEVCDFQHFVKLVVGLEKFSSQRFVSIDFLSHEPTFEKTSGEDSKDKPICSTLENILAMQRLMQ